MLFEENWNGWGINELIFTLGYKKRSKMDSV